MGRNLHRLPEKMFLLAFYVPELPSRAAVFVKAPRYTSFSIQETLQPIKLFSHAALRLAPSALSEIMITHKKGVFRGGRWWMRWHTL